MCDASLGRVLDAMDEYGMWDDTMLIVCADHGYLLGEHGWWAKVVQPWYDEVIHIPLFIADPRGTERGGHRKSLVQTLDFGPTLLELFGVDLTDDMQGVTLRDTIATDAPAREAGLFGMFGGHVCVTDGRYVYMRACKDASNQPLFEYTLMPTEMFTRFPVATLRQATLAEPFSFTKGVPVLRVPGRALRVMSPWGFGTLLYDLEDDPQQERPLIDDELELRMAARLVELMRATDAPADQFERLGLPMQGQPGLEHLLVGAQWPLVEASLNLSPPPSADEFPGVERELSMPLTSLLEVPGAGEILRRHAAALANGMATDPALGSFSLVELAAMGPGVLPRPPLREIASALAELRLDPAASSLATSGSAAPRYDA